MNTRKLLISALLRSDLRPGWVHPLWAKAQPHERHIGLSLCRRIVARFGGALELAARPSGGTRATLTFNEALA